VRVTAAEEALGWQPGSFADAFRANISESFVEALQSWPVYDLLVQLLKKKWKDADGNVVSGMWEGKPSGLYEKLTGLLDPLQRRPTDWPGAANVLTRQIHNHQDGLAAVGIVVEEWQSKDPKRERMIRIELKQKRADASGHLPDASRGRENATPGASAALDGSPSHNGEKREGGESMEAGADQASKASRAPGTGVNGSRESPQPASAKRPGGQYAELFRNLRGL
jgi:hypothetical protein